MRDHGGNMDEAIAIFGGDAGRWIDLSTGINRQPYPLPALEPGAWTDLPTRAARARLLSVAARTYGTRAEVIPVAGAQAAIQLMPRLALPGKAQVLAPTYNEHAAVLRLMGWDVIEVQAIEDLGGADLAVVVNPNNPDGAVYAPDDLLRVAGKVGRLVVDESFMDATPDYSLAPHADRAGLLVLRSFGKFYGLAGLRLGFVIGPGDDVAALDAMAGPWSVSGVALAIGRAALADAAWRKRTIERLHDEARHLDEMAVAAGWQLVGGTVLFRTFAVPDALAMQKSLARHQIWSRTFAYSTTWVRLGLPGSVAEWQRLADALRARL